MEKVVLAFGSFDIIHPGHLYYLKKAKQYGNKLIVVVARDDSIRKLKNRKPVFNQKDRAVIVNSLKIVDNAVVGKKITNLSDRYEIFKKYKPNVVVFGHDQKIDEKQLKAWLKKNKLNTKIVRINSFKRSFYSSSRIRKTL